jgi:hypothetical protein
MNSNAENAVEHESLDFYEQLLSASIHHKKFAPLWRQTKIERGGAIIRIKTLQHMNVIHIRKLLAEEVATAADTHTAENFRYLAELAPACPFAQRAITIRNFFQDRWNGNVHCSDRATMDEEADIDVTEGPQLAWDRRGTFFRPNSELEPHHTWKSDPNRQQNHSPTGLGICLFSLQADPLKKILHRYSHDQDQQDGVEGMQEKLEACGLEELQS